MKARVITTRKILVATVAAAAAGCSRPAVEITPATAEAVRTAPEGATRSSTVAEPSPPRPEPPPQEASPAEVAPPELAMAETVSREEERQRLVGELVPLTATQALARLEHFRPLCDDEGFPLVGNVMRKAPVETQPSELCGLVRARYVK